MMKKARVEKRQNNEDLDSAQSRRHLFNNLIAGDTFNFYI